MRRLPEPVASCSACPRLCRDACPVAVHSGRDDFIPSEKMRSVAALLGSTGATMERERLLACTDCGACTEHCLIDIPVAALLGAAARQIGAAATKAPAAETVQLDSLGLDGGVVHLLTTCGGHPIDCGGEIDLAALVGPAGPAGPADPAQAPAPPRRVEDPGRRVPASYEVVVVAPPLGSVCCGATLPAEVGDSELRARMARAMIATVPDGAVVVAGSPACALHLQQVAGPRLRVVALAGTAAAPGGRAPAREDQ